MLTDLSTHLKKGINIQSSFRPFNVEVGGKGNAVVLVIDPEHLINVNADIDLIDALCDWKLKLGIIVMQTDLFGDSC